MTLSRNKFAAEHRYCIPAPEHMDGHPSEHS